jgi:hypothetical protein
MNTCERCPQCYLVPQSQVIGENTWKLECEQHGHLAYGNSLEQVIEHWNKYVQFIQKQAA